MIEHATAAQEQAAQWQAIARLSPAVLYGRIAMARSALGRVTDPKVRLDIERCLDGWYEQDVDA